MKVGPSNLVTIALEPEILAMGFKRAKGKRRAFECYLGNEVIGGVEIDYSTAHLPRGVVAVDPLVYVTNRTVSRIVGGLLEEDPVRRPRAGVGHRLSYVMPGRDWRTWEVDTGVEGAVERQARSIAAALEDFGLPWMRRLAPLESFANAVYEQPPTNPGANYSRPVLRFLLEGRDAAVRELDTLPARFAGSQYIPPAGEVDRFVERFQRYLAVSSRGRSRHEQARAPQRRHQGSAR